jgi:methionine-R-sulfoxide reductase
MKLNNVSAREKRVIIDKKTELPFSGKYNDFWKEGIYICKLCDNTLFSSRAKFEAGCGWPSYDASFENSVEMVPDPDGIRIEIRCNKCKGHLGHIFKGEGFTPKNKRFCVNSISLKFVPKS